MGKIIAKVLVVLGTGTETTTVNGVDRLVAVRKEFQPGEEVTGLSDHDRRELLQLRAVLDETSEEAKGLIAVLDAQRGAAEFQRERQRVQQQRASTTAPAAPAEIAQTAKLPSDTTASVADDAEPKLAVSEVATDGAASQADGDATASPIEKPAKTSAKKNAAKG